MALLLSAPNSQGSCFKIFSISPSKWRSHLALSADSFWNHIFRFSVKGLPNPSGASSFAEPLKTDLLVGGQRFDIFSNFSRVKTKCIIHSVPIQTQNFHLCFMLLLFVFLADSLTQNMSVCVPFAKVKTPFLHDSLSLLIQMKCILIISYSTCEVTNIQQLG